MTNEQRSLLRQSLEALQYHQEQTRPIARTEAAIEALLAALAAPAVELKCDYCRDVGLTCTFGH